MPLWKCRECHHEWEGGKEPVPCDWCHAPGYVIENETPFEAFVRAAWSRPNKTHDESS